MKRIKNNKGITLIALVITIIVLVILAGITLSSLAGRRGLIRQAQEAEREHNRTTAFEEVTVASMQSIDNVGNMDLTKLENNLNDIGAQITEKGTDKWTVIHRDETFEIDIEYGEVTAEGESGTDTNGSYGGIYSEPGLEGKIAPTEIFEYEPITTTTASLNSTSLLATSEGDLPKARIKRIKQEYCNGNGYNEDTGEYPFSDTNYYIKYNGTTISDILVIPYQVEIEGELYEITEVNLFATGRNPMGTNACKTLPYVKTIIFPNTVEKIVKNDISYYSNPVLEKVVLPNKIKEIPESYFLACNKLSNIEIPNGVERIGSGAFNLCGELTTITIPKTVTEIDGEQFYNGTEDSKLTTINYTGTQTEWEAITMSEWTREKLNNLTINFNWK